MPQKRQSKAQLAVTMLELQNAVADGWIIDAPVARKQIPDRPDGGWYCHIILWRAGRVQVLTVPDDTILRQFLGEHDLTVTGQE